MRDLKEETRGGGQTDSLITCKSQNLNREETLGLMVLKTLSDIWLWVD